MDEAIVQLDWNAATWIFAGLFAAHFVVELWLDVLQARYLARRDERRVPPHLVGKVDPETIARSVRYNRARLRLGIATRFYDALPVWALVLFGFGLVEELVRVLGWGPVPSGLAFVGVVAAAGGVWGLPPELVGVFGVEARFGFNRQSLGGFVVDKLKGLALAIAIGGALITVVLVIMRSGDWWWLIAFGAVAVIQLAVAWIYPLLIMPLFNKLGPVEGDLARDVAELAERIGFPLAGVVSMDGSRRTAHSNAFVIGLVGARRIVLYDTLIARLDRQELLAVLAHELGHFKLGHVRRRLVLVLTGMAFLFALFGWIADLPAVYRGLGFSGPSGHAALLILGLYTSEGLFPFAFLLRKLSVRGELAADRFAVETMNGGAALSSALVALTKQNLTSPGSHRFYRGYRNTHPALRERLAAIEAHCRELGLPESSDHAQVGSAVSPESDDREDHGHREDTPDAGLGHGPGQLDVEPPQVEGDAGEDDEQR
jgi:STE24 endopeptidase